MQCVKATFINFLLKPKQLFGLPQVFKLSQINFGNYIVNMAEIRCFLHLI